MCNKLCAESFTSSSITIYRRLSPHVSTLSTVINYKYAQVEEKYTEPETQRETRAETQEEMQEETSSLITINMRLSPHVSNLSTVINYQHIQVVENRVRRKNRERERERERERQTDTQTDRQTDRNRESYSKSQSASKTINSSSFTVIELVRIVKTQ